MYWLKGILLWFLRTVFHEADLHYVDSDALLFPAALAASAERIHEDVLTVASDLGSTNINAGWIHVRNVEPPSIDKSDIEGTDLEWNAARHTMLDTT